MSRPIRIDLESNYESSDLSSSNSSLTYSPYSQYSLSPYNRSQFFDSDSYSEYSIINVPQAQATILTDRSRIVIPPDNINLVETNSINSNNSTSSNSTYSSNDSDIYIRLIYRHKLYFTYFYLFLIWILFFINVSDNKNNGYKKYVDLIYFQISAYPKCEYIKNQVWRLITNQFIHGDWFHILNNTIVFIPSSIIIEQIFGYKFMILQSIISSILATIAKANLNPFIFLIGSSSVVFSMIGCFFSVLIFNYDIFNNLTICHFCSIPIIILLLEIISYLFFRSNSTSYISHWVGFISGLLLSSQFIKIIKKKNWKIFLKGILFTCNISLIITLLYYYIKYDSINAYNDIFQKIEVNTCCYVHLYNLKNNITSNFICN